MSLQIIVLRTRFLAGDYVQIQNPEDNPPNNSYPCFFCSNIISNSNDKIAPENLIKETRCIVTESGWIKM